jgi:hypothetical protein
MMRRPAMQETKYTKEGPGTPGGSSWTPEWLHFDNSYFTEVPDLTSPALRWLLFIMFTPVCVALVNERLLSVSNEGFWLMPVGCVCRFRRRRTQTCWCCPLTAACSRTRASGALSA